MCKYFKMKLRKLSNNLRFLLIKMSSNKITTFGISLSCIDIVTTLYHSVLKINKRNFKSSLRNRFILSKGHAATSLYVALEHKNIISKRSKHLH